eukprot:Gb_22275 [translate_table: standard]
MHISRPENCSSRVQILGREELYGMPQILPLHQTTCVNNPSSLQLRDHVSGCKVSEMETLIQMGGFQQYRNSVNNEEFTDLGIMALQDPHNGPLQPDDLSAIIQKKYNGSGSLKPSSDYMDQPNALPILEQQQEGSVLVSDSQVFSLSDLEADHMQIIHAKKTMPTVQCRPSKRWAGLPGERKEVLKQKKCASLMTTSKRHNHVLSERQRRQDMNKSFARMRSLLPNPDQKIDKATIVFEMINYIQTLQRHVEVNVKKCSTASVLVPNQGNPINDEHGSIHPASHNPSSECMGRNAIVTAPSSDQKMKENTPKITLHYDRNDIFITISCLKKVNLLPSIVLVLEQCKLEVMDAFVSATDTMAFHCLHVKAPEILNTFERESLHGNLQKLIRSDFEITFEQEIWH